MDTNDPDLEPLELIRKTEASCRRRLAAAHTAAETAVQRAYQETEEIVREAQAAGKREGEARRDQILADTRREVETVLLAARQKAEGVRNIDPQRIDRAVRDVLERLLERGPGESEP
jgi:vacuolar-type H+-ATPase subunit H